MAIKPEVQYPGQITPATADYPNGSAVNVSTPGAGDGTPLEEVWLNDLWGFTQALLLNTAITPTGNADTALASQYLDATRIIAQAGSRLPELSNDATFPNTHYNVSAGIVWDDTYLVPISLAAPLTKRVDQNWAAGDGNGAFPSTLTLAPGDWLHVFELINPDNGLVDSGVDTDINAANLLADATGYTLKKRVGSVFQEAGAPDHLRQFNQDGRYVGWALPSVDLDVSPPAIVRTNVSLLTPPGVVTEAHVAMVSGTDETATANPFFVAELYVPDFDPVTTKITKGESGSSVEAARDRAFTDNVFTDLSRQVWYKFGSTNGATHQCQIITWGWKEIF